MKLEANTPQTIQPFLEVFQTIPVSNESNAMLSAVQNKIRLKDVKMELATVHMPIKLFAIAIVLTIIVSTM